MATQFTYYLPLGAAGDKRKQHKKTKFFGTNADDLELRAMLYATYMKHIGNEMPKHYTDGASTFVNEDGTVVVRTCINKQSIDQ